MLVMKETKDRKAGGSCLQSKLLGRQTEEDGNLRPVWAEKVRPYIKEQASRFFVPVILAMCEEYVREYQSEAQATPGRRSDLIWKITKAKRAGGVA
jgi:hypothetical protein